MNRHQRDEFLARKREANQNYHDLVTLCQSCRFYRPGLGATYYDGVDAAECLHPLPRVFERVFDIALNDSGPRGGADNIGGDCWAFRPYVHERKIA